MEILFPVLVFHQKLKIFKYTYPNLISEEMGRLVYTCSIFVTSLIFWVTEVCKSY